MFRDGHRVWVGVIWGLAGGWLGVGWELVGGWCGCQLGVDKSWGGEGAHSSKPAPGKRWGTALGL